MKPPERPRAAVIRRRVRERIEIDLPEHLPRPQAPNARKHAKTFVGALAAMVAAGTLLLASPLTSESGDATHPADALLTAVSAAAVTGLVTVDTADHWNLFGEMVILTLIQAGGLGFMVGAGLLLQALRRGQNRLSDMLLMQDGAPTLSLRETAEMTGRIVRFTIAVELAGAIALTVRFWQDMPFPRALWFGFFHSISAFCNAGFDLHGGFASVSAYQGSVAVNLVLIGLIQAGALSYIVFADIGRCRRWRNLALDTKLVLIVNVLLVAGAALFFLIAEMDGALAGRSSADKGLGALFQSVAARTAGFASVNFGEVHAATLFVWVLVMGIGGAAGSTAGGVKLATVGVVVVAVLSTLRGDEEPRAFGRTIPTALIMRAFAVIFLFVAVHFVATVALVATENLFSDLEHSFISIMFETMSAAATVGLTTGITPELSSAGKLVLCATMFFGRLGPLTTAYALQRRQRPARYRYPTGQVRIG